MNAKQQNPSTSQRCRDYAWRRLEFRHSAARRPFVIRFYNQEDISKNIDYRDKDPTRPSFRIDTSYNKRFYTWTTSTGMNTYYSKVRKNCK